MSWHYLQEQEEACWPHACLDGAPNALWNLMPLLEGSSSPDSATDTSTGSLSGTTSRPSMDAPGEAQLMLFQEASPAKTSAQRVRVKDSPAAVQGLFLRCCELLGRHNLRLSFRKTVRDCVPVVLAPSSKNLPAWGLTFDGACWELGTSARLLEETECGSLLPTPNGWPTPTAGDAKSSGRRLSNPNSTAHAGSSLTDAVNGGPTTQRTGKLNPSWVESYLMMWPLGWTVVHGSARLAMDRFQRWLDWHGTYSGD